MAVTHKSAISFGLVHIPVNLYTATQDTDISFNQLHKADHSRIKYKKVCTHCGKEVKAEDIVRGYQYEKDKYVTVSDEEIEKIKTEKDKTIRILQFFNLDQISPVYFDKSYHAVPEKGGGKAFELLRLAMMNKQKAALGKSVFGASEKLIMIIPREDGILIQTLLYYGEVKEIPTQHEKPKPAKAELDMAQMLIDSMEKDFDPAAYNDEFQEKLKALIQTKVDGNEVKSPKAEKPGKIIDLMEALKASVEKNKKPKPTPKPAAAKAR